MSADERIKLIGLYSEILEKHYLSDDEMYPKDFIELIKTHISALVVGIN